MTYTLRTKDNPGDPGRSLDQNESVDNDIFFYQQIRYVAVEVFDPALYCITGDGKKYFHIPADLDGYNLVTAHAYHPTAGAGANPTLLQLYNVTQTSDMFTDKLRIDGGEQDSYYAVSGVLIDVDHDGISTYDVLRVDVDNLPETTLPKGLVVTLGFQRP
jgi:hypothetical protein